MYYNKFSWNNNINSCNNSYLHSQICIDSFILSDNDKYNDSYFYSYIFGKDRNYSESENSSSRTKTRTNDTNDNNSTIVKKYKHLWIEYKNCYGLNYKKNLKSKINICEYC
uniref:Acetyl-coenzyme A carboxylase carboxyl transferase subunit beta n=1 Tax=Cajanus cajan TaxID=3821 RepID=A0A151R196_CAJCA|nr:Acetyl-coenzyme A carboxylase carboxyl transferase subunit beta [Cajanus cajan]